MRTAGWIMAALVAGFLLGGVQPRRQLAEAEEQLKDMAVQLEDARARAERAQRPRTFSIPGVGDLYDPDFGGGGAAGGERRRAGTAGGEASPEDTGGPEGPAPTAAELPAEELSAAVEAQRLRAAQSRAALIEQLDLSAEEVGELDAILADMNDQLAAIADEVVEIALYGEEPAPVELMAITHEVTGILLDAQEALDDLAGGETLDPTSGAAWSYVDLGAFQEATLELTEQRGE